jgi:hypothetical protein
MGRTSVNAERGLSSGSDAANPRAVGATLHAPTLALLCARVGCVRARFVLHHDLALVAELTHAAQAARVGLECTKASGRGHGPSLLSFRLVLPPVLGLGAGVDGRVRAHARIANVAVHSQAVGIHRARLIVVRGLQRGCVRGGAGGSELDAAERRGAGAPRHTVTSKLRASTASDSQRDDDYPWNVPPVHACPVLSHCQYGPPPSAPTTPASTHVHMTPAPAPRQFMQEPA